MSMTDPIADMLVRIKNGLMRNAEKVVIPASGLKTQILAILKEKGYVKDVKTTVEDKKQSLHVYLKYTARGGKLINRLVRISKPGRRVYRNAAKMGKILDGFGLAIISTHKGVMSDKECKKLKLGGEVLCEVW
ncbi:MAG: 30S ribosomal protein S8 [Planctomycetota bacterium]